jgi:hypothetical protein
MKQAQRKWLLAVFIIFSSLACLSELPASVPKLVRFSGQATGKTGTVAVTFSLYRNEIGGAPLWQETQLVHVGDNGRYTVTLGSEDPEGLPETLFESNEARWLGVRIEGDGELPRTMLLSVPYALKAFSADTLAGHSANEFVLLPGVAGSNRIATSSAQMAGASLFAVNAVNGAPNYLSKFLNSTDLGPSLLYDSGTSIGIGTTVPTRTLSVFDASGSRLFKVLQQNYNSTYPAAEIVSAGASALDVGAWDTVREKWAFRVFNNVSRGERDDISATVGGAQVFGIRADGMVGIGTQAQTRLMSVYDASLARRPMKVTQSNPGNPYAAMEVTSAGVSALDLGQWDTVSTRWILRTYRNASRAEADDISKAGGRLFAFGVRADGNVGIGTETPTARLEVAGALKISGGSSGLVFPDGSIQTTAAGSGTGGNSGGPAVFTAASSAGVITATQTGSGNPILLPGGVPPSAVHGVASATNNSVAGVAGESVSDAGYGLVGLNSATAGDAIGVAGYSRLSPLGIGVYGEASSTDPAATPTGVFGLVSGTASGSTGVVGEAVATTGDTTGVYGTSLSTSGYGVEGDAYATTGIAIGVAGFSDSDQGRGVMGNATSPTGQTYGVRGLTASDAGTGVAGVSNSTTGATVGASGEVSSASGVAGLFTNNSGGGDILVGRTGPGTNVFRIDSAGKAFFNGGTQTSGADFAENFAVRGQKQEYEPGDLLAIDETGARRLKRTDAPYSTLVAGVYSTKPGVLAQPYSIDSRQGESEVPLAMVGVVPLKVTTANGIIAAGDLLVSSAIEGRAMKGTDRTRMLGAVVGKALEACRNGEKTILVLVTLQ